MEMFVRLGGVCGPVFHMRKHTQRERASEKKREREMHKPQLQ